MLVDLAEGDGFNVERLDYTVRMNVRSVFLMTKHALPHLKKTRGNIVYAGSQASAVRRCSHYGGTDGFIHSF